jgi:hypothetical protein
MLQIKQQLIINTHKPKHRVTQTGRIPPVTKRFFRPARLKPRPMHQTGKTGSPTLLPYSRTTSSYGQISRNTL